MAITTFAMAFACVVEAVGEDRTERGDDHEGKDDVVTHVVSILGS